MTVPTACNLSKGFQIEQQDMEKDVVQGFGDLKETHHILHEGRNQGVRTQRVLLTARHPH